MRKPLSVPFGRLQETVAGLPDQALWAFKAGRSWDSDYTLKRWNSRASLALAIRMQERRARRADDWRPVIALSPGEGY